MTATTLFTRLSGNIFLMTEQIGDSVAGRTVEQTDSVDQFKRKGYTVYNEGKIQMFGHVLTPRLKKKMQVNGYIVDDSEHIVILKSPADQYIIILRSGISLSLDEIRAPYYRWKSNMSKFK
jgi:hypothetical protein